MYGWGSNQERIRERATHDGAEEAALELVELLQVEPRGLRPLVVEDLLVHTLVVQVLGRHHLHKDINCSSFTAQQCEWFLECLVFQCRPPTPELSQPPGSGMSTRVSGSVTNWQAISQFFFFFPPARIRQLTRPRYSSDREMSCLASMGAAVGTGIGADNGVLMI